MRGKGVGSLIVCSVGIYASFLTWALVQEPLTTKIWPNSKKQFQYPNIIAMSQAFIAMTVGFLYLRWKKSPYSVIQLIKDRKKQLALISFTQSTSNPLATYSLQYVDYLTYMLAKSCKMIPVLLVHLILYRTPIANQKKIIAIVVSLGVTIFTLGSGQKGNSLNDSTFSLYGYGLLVLSLFLDGLTNATQDKMLKAAKSESKTKEKSEDDQSKIITGAHLMFSLNFCMILWNILHLCTIDKEQTVAASKMLRQDPEIIYYLVLYSICGAIGQCFIFFTLEQFGSLVLIMITVTRKMISMVLSIFVFGKSVYPLQWLGILCVFGGIIYEAMSKRAGMANKNKNVLEKKNN